MYRLSRLRGRLAVCARAASLLSLYALLAITLYVCLDVMLRKLWAISLSGGDELSGYALAMAVGWSAAYALYQDSFIRVDFLHRRFPLKLRAWSDLAATATSAVFAVFLTWYAVKLGWESLSFGVVSNTPLRVLLWIPQFAWATGFLFFSLSAILLFLETLALILVGKHDKVITLVNAPSNASI